MNALIDLLDCLCAHLAECELPALWSVNLTASSAGHSVSVQLACHEPSEIAAGLLAWADTLDEVIAEVWRVPGGDGVHLSVIGRLTGGAVVRAYGGVPFTDHGLGADLTPDASTTVSLAALRAMVTPGEVMI